MTCGRALPALCEGILDGAAASHSAELVRGEFRFSLQKAPSSGPSGPPSPQGEKDRGRLR